MPLITGTITRDGAAIDALVGPAIPPQVHQPKRTSLPIRAVLDTGAAVTGVSRRLLKSLGLAAIDSIQIRVPVGPTQIADRFRIRLAFVSGGTRLDFADILVIAADCFAEHEELQALIGRDVLNHCTFQYWGTVNEFQFSY